MSDAVNLSAPPEDTLGAFCHENHVGHAPTGDGKLNGLQFAAKDVMDVEGSVTGFGQPDWLKSHQVAKTSAPVVEHLLHAGATLVGKTITDELSYSLTGENVHYGTPINSKAADRVCGGSSSGSVAAVTGGLVDFALGTDCAGSVRLPASYCGVYGMRPTHDRVDSTQVIPFAPSFDTVGWLARDAHTLHNVGKVLLGEDQKQAATGKLLIASDCFAMVEPQISDALAPAVQTLKGLFTEAEEITVDPNGLDNWMECFRHIQGYEIWQSLGEWIEKNQPSLGPGIDERVAWAQTVTLKQANEAREFRQQAKAHLDELIKPGDILCLPSSPRVAPLKNTATSTVEVTYRYQAICLLSIAGLGGLPELSLPMATVDGLPLGLSIIGSRGSDLQLLSLAEQMAEKIA